MTDDTLTQLNLLSYKAEIEALITDREAMKADGSYTEGAFLEISNRLYQIQQEIIELKH
jgi:hypothetical protein